MRKIEALRRAASFESSLASQLRKINKINYLRGHRSSAYVSLVPSVICDGQAALYDVRLVRLDDTPAHGYWAVYLSIVPLCDFFRWPASLPFAGMNAAVISQTTVNAPSILFTMFLRVSVSDCSSAPSPLDIERPEL